VFAWDTIEKLNVKAKMWRDLVSDEEFSRRDIITLQDPQNVESRNLSSFKYLKDRESGLTEEQQQRPSDATINVNLEAIGSSARILKAKEAVARAREERDRKCGLPRFEIEGGDGTPSGKDGLRRAPIMTQSGQQTPYNAARHTMALPLLPSRAPDSHLTQLPTLPS
jgi:peptidyl-prolyl cis-trans isomerase-like protein 2